MDILTFKKKNYQPQVLKRFKKPLNRKIDEIELCKLQYTGSFKNTIETKVPLFMNKYFKRHYPNVDKWYTKKVINDVKQGLRNIYVVKHKKDDEILGIAITRISSGKYANKTPKICSFYVCSEIRRRYFGKKLFEKVLGELKEICPNEEIIITVPEERVFERNTGISFKTFLEKYNFTNVDEVPGKYREGKLEYIFKK
ncbi:GNAT family N-acetyltransferase [Methanococcus sp. CF]